MAVDRLSKTDRAYVLHQVNRTRSSATETNVAGLRRWTNDTGKSSTSARLIQYADNTVWLRKEDGGLARIPFSRLSQEDQTYVMQQARKS